MTMHECENGYCRNTAKLGEPFCGKCADEISTLESRKHALERIRADLAQSQTYPAGSPSCIYHMCEAVSRLTQLVEELHDLG